MSYSVEQPPYCDPLRLSPRLDGLLFLQAFIVPAGTLNAVACFALRRAAIDTSVSKTRAYALTIQSIQSVRPSVELNEYIIDDMTDDGRRLTIYTYTIRIHYSYVVLIGCTRGHTNHSCRARTIVAYCTRGCASRSLLT